VTTDEIPCAECWKNYQKHLLKVENELVRYKQAVGAIASVIVNEGTHPAYHQQILERHKREWVSLWTAIEQAVEVLYSQLDEINDN
jgi:hypothetical protein